MKAKHYIEDDDNRIYFSLRRTGRKTIGIFVDRNGEVKVHAPIGASEKQVCEAVRRKSDWIIKKVHEVTERNACPVCKQFVSGEKFTCLGKELTFQIEERDLDKPDVFVQENTMAVYLPYGLYGESRKQAIKEAVTKWYRQYFAEFAKERIDRYSLRLKAASRRVVVKDQKTRWGSCSKRGNINLNWRLVMAPVDVVDYVVVHELCHLRVMNHSRDFWNLVASILPDFQESRKWLKSNGHRLRI